MKIDEGKCINCRMCLPYCPVSAISLEEGRVVIDQDECVECGVCLHVDVCAKKAIYMPKESFEYPRAIRMQFSDPGVQHPNLKSWGRGTEEAKTNDVTGKFGRGEFGLLLEFGRPVTGTRIAEIEKIARLIRSMGIPILEDNPLYGLLTEDMSGSFKPEYVKEKILSGILEIRIDKSEELESILERILSALKELDTVVSVGLVSRFEDDATLPVIDRLKKMGLAVRPNAKINVGLGRPMVNR